MPNSSESVDRVRVFGERSEAVERIAPGFFWPTIEAAHIARYRWASRWVKNRVVLDIACGTGYGALILRDAGARTVLSLDVSRDALRFGYDRYRIVAACTDALKLPLRTESCDTVVSLETIEHLHDPLAFGRELRRVIRPGGDVLLSTPNALRSIGSNPYHLREMSIDELRQLLEESGFRLERVWAQHWGLGPGWWHRIRGLRGLLFRIERIARVTPRLRFGLAPLYWCLHAVRR
jgi:SAM-dependent methyltransferase